MELSDPDLVSLLARLKAAEMGHAMPMQDVPDCLLGQLSARLMDARWGCVWACAREATLGQYLVPVWKVKMEVLSEALLARPTACWSACLTVLALEVLLGYDLALQRQ